MLNAKLCCLLLCAISFSVSAGAAPPTPPKIPTIEEIDIDSSSFREKMKRDRADALKAISSRHHVTRKFIVGWEIHHDYYFIKPKKHDEIIFPDFLDRRIRDVFNAENSNEILSTRVGHRLICECVGIEWRYNGSHEFAVQSAKLQWVK